MKTWKLLFLFIITSSIGLMSCSKDNDNNEDNDNVSYPKTLIYINSPTITFQVYVGSSMGGQPATTLNLDPKMFWSDYITFGKDFYKESSMTFNSETEVSFSNFSHNYQYKFKDRAFWIYDSKWTCVGFGNPNAVAIIKGLTYSRRNNNWIIEQRDGIVDPNSLVGAGKLFSSFSDMKNVTDTIAFCNILHTFE